MCFLLGSVKYSNFLPERVRQGISSAEEGLLESVDHRFAGMHKRCPSWMPGRRQVHRRRCMAACRFNEQQAQIKPGQCKSLLVKLMATPSRTRM